MDYMMVGHSAVCWAACSVALMATTTAARKDPCWAGLRAALTDAI